MKIPRDLSGWNVVKVLCRDWSYRVFIKKAATSFLKPKLLRTNVLPCPPIATLNAILRSVAQHKGVEREELLRSLR